MPGTYPAWKINGEMISGMLSPKISCIPEELEFALKRHWIIDGSNISEMFKAFEIKERLFLRKLEEEDFKLMVFVIRAPDLCSHITTPKIPKKILKNIYLSYIKIDNFIGKLLRKYENGNVSNIMIFSDHGLKTYSKVIYFNRWLEKNKIIYLNKGSKEGIIRSHLLRLSFFIEPIIDKFSFINNLTKRLFNSKSPQQQKLKFIHLEASKNILQHTSNVGSLVLGAKHIQKKKLIEDKLKKEKWVKEVITPDIKNFPDFYVVLKNDYLFSGEPSRFIKGYLNYIAHYQIGLFIAFGRNFKKGRGSLVNYYDIAPTILNLLNLKKPDYMIGKSLPIIKKNVNDFN